MSKAIVRPTGNHYHLSLIDDEGREYSAPSEVKVGLVYSGDSGIEQEYHVSVGAFGIVVKEKQFDEFIWFLLNSMAVAAGYSSFGHHSTPVNPYGRSIHWVTDAEKERMAHLGSPKSEEA